MVKSSPINDHGAAHFKNILPYHDWPAILRRVNRVRTAAARGMPRKTATLLATVEYEISSVPSSRLMTLIKKIASGA